MVLFAVGALDSRQVLAVPMIADEARREQLAPQLVLAREGVVEEKRVAHGLIDDAVQDVRQELALRG